MVKRQTVWLSTMMVLSLMLIGYYTLGTPASPSTQDVNASGSTSVVPTNANSLGATKTVAKTSTSTAPASKPTSSLANDWLHKHRSIKCNLSQRSFKRCKMRLVIRM